MFLRLNYHYDMYLISVSLGEHSESSCDVAGLRLSVMVSTLEVVCQWSEIGSGTTTMGHLSMSYPPTSINEMLNFGGFNIFNFNYQHLFRFRELSNIVQYSRWKNCSNSDTSNRSMSIATVINFVSISAMQRHDI